MYSDPLFQTVRYFYQTIEVCALLAKISFADQILSKYVCVNF